MTPTEAPNVAATEVLCASPEFDVSGLAAMPRDPATVNAFAPSELDSDKRSTLVAVELLNVLAVVLPPAVV